MKTFAYGSNSFPLPPLVQVRDLPKGSLFYTMHNRQLLQRNGWHKDSESTHCINTTDLETGSANVIGAHVHVIPHPPEERECNECDWNGPVTACLWCGEVGPLCPECNETTVTRGN